MSLSCVEIQSLHLNLACNSQAVFAIMSGVEWGSSCTARCIKCPLNFARAHGRSSLNCWVYREWRRGWKRLVFSRHYLSWVSARRVELQSQLLSVADIQNQTRRQKKPRSLLLSSLQNTFIPKGKTFDQLCTSQIQECPSPPGIWHELSPGWEGFWHLFRFRCPGHLTPWKKRRKTLCIPKICININRDRSVKDCFKFYFVTTWAQWSIEIKDTRHHEPAKSVL